MVRATIDIEYTNLSKMQSLKRIVLKVLVIVLLSCDCLAHQVYRGAVYEHRPKQSLEDNLKDYLRVAHEAAEKGADILVFPEYGLLALLPKSRQFLKSIAANMQTIFIESVLCDSETLISVLTSRYVDIVSQFSCLAKLLRIFIAFNFCAYEICNRTFDKNCPEDGVYLYNTNFVFDKHGKLVAVYRKYHLFEEPYFNQPQMQDVSVFTTPFGRFGMFTCFDIMFSSAALLVQKYHVDNIIYPTFWIDSYPLYISIDVQSTWAKTFNVNLLAANIHSPSYGALGSGIYSGINGPLIYTYDTSGNNSHLLIADLTSGLDLSTGVKEGSNVSRSGDHFMFVTRFDAMNMTRLRNASGSLERNHEGLQCQLGYAFEKKNNTEIYYFGALNGSIRTDNRKHSWSVELCILFMCLDESCSSYPSLANNAFSYLSITGTFSNLNVFPTIMQSGFQLPHRDEWKISKENIETVQESNSCHLLYVALYGRNYALDKP